MLLLKDCPCGGEPEVFVTRGEQIMKFTMAREDRVVLKHKDVLYAYCKGCGQYIEIEDKELALGARA